MRELNICIDIDGTLTDPYYWLPYANGFFRKQMTEDEITVYSIAEVMQVSDVEYADFYMKNRYNMHGSPNLRQDARYYVEKIYENHQVHFVTAREQALEVITLAYLSQKRIPYDSLHVTGSPNKIVQAEALDCDLFIEDSLYNATLLAQAGYIVLLMDTNYNRSDLLHPLISRVNTWQDVFAKVTRLATALQAIC